MGLGGGVDLVRSCRIVCVDENRNQFVQKAFQGKPFTWVIEHWIQASTAMRPELAGQKPGKDDRFVAAQRDSYLGVKVLMRKHQGP